ncbi:hypothetical protein [Paenibacillus qinlingensis]|uniref:hypothetical protein n=1 Tax=Paenibacillus qinlingensis TaxID=1837343 RepID=UPI00156334DF|nr:hypothetical protein [Paenibacillus qinlingensis]NQX63003.1 hypothetical protein [Paenibacillus qinlingensis]
MAHTAEIQRVQTLLRHAQQLSGTSNQADERIKSLNIRLAALQQLAGGTSASTDTESESAVVEVSEEVTTEAAEEAAEVANEEVNEETNNEVAAAEEATAPDEQN